VFGFLHQSAHLPKDFGPFNLHKAGLLGQGDLDLEVPGLQVGAGFHEKEPAAGLEQSKQLG
jgi:hypothetical protein